jgi:hypothetical protein
MVGETLRHLYKKEFPEIVIKNVRVLLLEGLTSSMMCVQKKFHSSGKQPEYCKISGRFPDEWDIFWTHPFFVGRARISFLSLSVK